MADLIIDPGHGGTDPGALGNMIVEKNVNMDISLYQFKRLKELGIDVALTRSTDATLDSVARTNIVKRSGAKHCISNHINAGGGDGHEVIHSIKASSKFSDIVAKELSNVGQNLRRVFTRKNDSGGDYYFMHRMTGSVETIIVEYGFLDSKSDDVVQLKRDWKIFAEAVVKAYCLYIGHKYVAPNQPKEVKPVSNTRYNDVDKSHSAYEALERISKTDIIKGYTDGTFRPNEPVTRAQMAIIVDRLLSQKG